MDRVAADLRKEHDGLEQRRDAAQATGGLLFGNDAFREQDEMDTSDADLVRVEEELVRVANRLARLSAQQELIGAIGQLLATWSSGPR